MSRRAVVPCLWVLVACGDPPPSIDGVGRPVPESTPRQWNDPNADLLDENGVPRESDQQVAGLVLPRGLTEVSELRETRRRVYTSAIDVGRLARYFGPRLTTIEIERRGETVVYRNAVPRGVQGGVVRLDVTLAPSSEHAARVELVERAPPPPPGAAIPDEEIRRHLEAQRRQQE